MLVAARALAAAVVVAAWGIAAWVVAASAVAAPAFARGPARCAARPMRLLVRGADGRSVSLLTLDAKGRVVAGLGAAPSQGLEARLDPRGCLRRRDDGVWVELTTNGRLWTPHELFTTSSTAPVSIAVAGGAMLRLRADGVVERVAADGTIERNPYGTVVVEGYDESAPCGAQLLLGAWLSMIPSMAVSDGNPRAEPRPADGACR